ncbi:unnamed protein product [Trichobilharzia szidati]|nr:unnamed protein product [Trichobilharzia szidati]
MSIIKSFLKKFKAVDEPKKKPFSDGIERNVNPTDIWEIISELGDGAFGKVYKTRKRDNELCAALKRVEFDSEDELEDFMVEIDILTNFKHKNILSLHEVYIYDNKLWMYLELCGGGALDSLMEKLEKPLTEPQIRFISHEVLEGLGFLHENLIIHRDMKAGNILLTVNYEVKLADFGVSAKLADERQRRSTFIGTPYWMAPEVITCETFKDAPYNWKADIWSFGITLIELAQMRPPHNSINPTRVLLKISKSDPPVLSKPHLWSPKFNKFLSRILQKDPNQRPECKDLLLDPFVSDVKESDRKVIQILLCEANADIIETVEDLDPNEPIDEIDDNEIGALILPDSTKLSIPVEEEYEEDEENNSNNTTNNNTNSSTDDQSSSSSKDVKHGSTGTGGGDSGVGLSRANSDDRHETETPSKVTSSDGTVALKNEVMHEVVNQLITDVITSDTQAPSISSCVYEIMQEYSSSMEKTPNSTSERSTTDNERVIDTANGVRKEVIPPKKELTSSDTTNNKPVVNNQALSNPSSSTSSSSSGHSNNSNNVNMVTSPLKRQNSAYRTRTRTRRFVIDGQVVTTTSKHIVNTNSEERRFHEDEQVKRKAVLRAFRILAKQEAHQTRELNERAQQQMEILESKMNAEYSALTKSYDQKMEVVIRNCKLQMERLDKEFELEMKRIRSETSKEERTFKDRLKSEIDTYDRAMRKAAKRELNKLDQDTVKSNSSLASLNSNQSTNSLVCQRLTLFREDQASRVNSRIYELHSEYNRRRSVLRNENLSETHTLRLNFEEDKWKLEQRYLCMKHQLDRNRLLDLFMIKREQLTGRSELELTELKQTINMERSKLQTIHSIERKNFTKSMKALNKRSILTLQRQSRITAQQMDENQKRMNQELAQLEAKQKAQCEALEQSIHYRLKELEQSVIEKRNALIDQETIRLQELDIKHQNELRIYTESLPRTKTVLKEQFAQEFKEDSLKTNGGGGNSYSSSSYSLYGSPKSRHKHSIPRPITSLANVRWGTLSNSSNNTTPESRPSRIITLFSQEVNNSTNSLRTRDTK